MPMNIFNWNGPDFLNLYIALLFAFTIIGAVCRVFLRSPSGSLASNIHLEPAEVAYLAGGPVRAVDAAVSKLVTADLIQVEGSGTLKALAPDIRPRDEVEHLVLTAAHAKRSIHELRRDAASGTTRIHSRLAELGLLPDGAGTFWSTIGGGLLCLLMLAGGIKVGIGIMRDKPVMFLVALEILSVLPLVLLAKIPRRSRRGDQMLASIERDNTALQHALSSGASLAPSDLGFAIGLYGLACLSGPQHQSLRNDLAASSSYGNAYAGGGSSCSSGGGGCGGGGGSGSGGGCGGCGSSS